MPQLEHNTSISQQWSQWGWMVRGGEQPKTKANFKMDDHLGSTYFGVFFQFGCDWQKY